jgi:hypothetical protein
MPEIQRNSQRFAVFEGDAAKTLPFSCPSPVSR